MFHVAHDAPDQAFDRIKMDLRFTIVGMQTGRKFESALALLRFWSHLSKTSSFGGPTFQGRRFLARDLICVQIVTADVPHGARCPRSGFGGNENGDLGFTTVGMQMGMEFETALDLHRHWSPLSKPPKLFGGPTFQGCRFLGTCLCADC